MKPKKKLSLIILFLLLINIFLNTVVLATEPNINAGAVYSAEMSTGKVIYEKNAHEKKFPASTTKVMTALLTLENCELTDKAVASYNAISLIKSGYSNANIQIGEELTIKDLLYALMLNSANEAANVLAEHIAGSIESFATMMNTRAEELGCKNTHFVNANGVHSEDHYTTAYDLYLIANEAMKNPTFREIVSTKNYTLPATDKYPEADRVCTNTNQLIILNNNARKDNYYYKYAIGIKTGFTTQARNCLISAASRDGLEFINVVLDAGATEDGLSVRYLDSIELFNYEYNNYTITKLKETNSIIKTIEVKKATKETRNLNLLIQDPISIIHNKEIDATSVIPEISLNENLEAPIAKGDIVGSIKYTVDGIDYSSKLIAEHDVEKANYSIYLIITGIVVLIFAILIMPKKKGYRNKRIRKK